MTEEKKLTTSEIRDVINEIYNSSKGPIKEAIDNAMENLFEPDVSRDIALLYVFFQLSSELLDEVVKEHQTSMLEKQQKQLEAIHFYKRLGMGV